MLFAGGEHIIVRLRLLNDQPHALDIVPRVTPVAPGGKIAEVELALMPQLDRRDGAADLPRHEGFAPRRSFVIEQDAVRCVHSIGFAIIDRDPIGVELCRGIGRARIKRRGFAVAALPAPCRRVPTSMLDKTAPCPRAAGCGWPQAGAASRARRRWRCIRGFRTKRARGSGRRDCRFRRCTS